MCINVLYVLKEKDTDNYITDDTISNLCWYPHNIY